MTLYDDRRREDIAAKLLAAMLDGACSAAVNPLFIEAYTKGILAAPRLAVQLTDDLLARLNQSKQHESQS